MGTDEKTPLYQQLGEWIRQRLIEGYDALMAYDWARVTVESCIRIGRGMYSAVDKSVERMSTFMKGDMDGWANGLIETSGERMGGAMKRLMIRYDRLYRKYRLPVKMIVTTLLLVLSMVLLLLYTSRTTALMCAGMGFSWLADAMLMGYPPIRRGFRQYFLWGMGGFACAMTVYTGAFLNLYERTPGAEGALIFLSAWSIFGFIAGVIWLCCIAFNKKQLVALRVGSLLYAMLVSAMAASACVVAIATTGRVWWLVPGAIFFYISDMMIALFDFGSVRVKHPDGWIWLFYAPAQLLLITGACAAAAI